MYSYSSEDFEMTLAQFYIRRKRYYKKFFENVDRLILRYYPGCENLEEVCKKIKIGLLPVKHLSDGNASELLDLSNQLMNYKIFSRGSYSEEQSHENLLEEYVKNRKNCTLFRAMKLNYAGLKSKDISKLTQFNTYKSFVFERETVNQISDSVDKILDNEYLTKMRVKPKYFENFKLHEVKSSFQAIDEKFRKTFPKDVIDEVDKRGAGEQFFVEALDKYILDERRR